MEVITVLQTLKASLVLKALEVTIADLDASVTDGISIFEGGVWFGCISNEHLPQKFRDLEGVNAKPSGATGIYVIRGGLVHSFRPLSELQLLQSSSKKGLSQWLILDKIAIKSKLLTCMMRALQII
jgi:hypothetical protein